jgi:hypothetical protein
MKVNKTSNPVLSMSRSELISPKFNISKGYDCGGKEKYVVGKISKSTRI